MDSKLQRLNCSNVLIWAFRNFMNSSMADELRRFGIKVTLFYFGGIDSPFWDNVSLKVDRSKMLTTETAANAIMFALSADPLAVPMEINIQPESHLFF